jgi:hypothetical protein
MNGLELATTDELINELMSRFEHAVFCGMKLPTEDWQNINRKWKGNSHTCAGLGFQVARTVLDDFEERSIPDVR